MNNVDWKELDELVGIPTAKIYANFTVGVVVGDILGEKYLHMLLHLTHDIKSILEVTGLSDPILGMGMGPMELGK